MDDKILAFEARANSLVLDSARNVNLTIDIIHEDFENDLEESKKSVTMGVRTNLETLGPEENLSGSQNFSNNPFTLNNTNTFNHEKSFKFENYPPNDAKGQLRDRYDLRENSAANGFNSTNNNFSDFSNTGGNLGEYFNRTGTSDSDPKDSTSKTPTTSAINNLGPESFMRKNQPKKNLSHKTTTIKHTPETDNKNSTFSNNGAGPSHVDATDMTISPIKSEKFSSDGISNIAREIKKSSIVQDVLRDKTWKLEINDELKINYKMQKLASNNLKMLKDMHISIAHFKSQTKTRSNGHDCSQLYSQNTTFDAGRQADNSFIGRYSQISG